MSATVKKSVETGWGVHCYDDITLFEKKFAEYIGVSHCVATSSATGALHLGLHALGVGPGDEVVLADINWIATVAPVVHVGATPVFVDIDPITWCIDPAQFEKALTNRTKAVIVTHLYGNLGDVATIRTICSSRNISLIEDSAEAIGSYIDNKHAGSMGDFGYFSFHGTKTLTAGEGGAFVTNNEDLFVRVKLTEQPWTSFG